MTNSSFTLFLTRWSNFIIGKRIKLNVKKRNHSNVTKEDLLLMIDLFFLPYEHGGKAKHLVSEFKWLQAYAPPIKLSEQNVTLVCISLYLIEYSVV